MTFSGTNQGTATASKTVSLGTSKPAALVRDGQYLSSSLSICGPTSLSLAAYPDQNFSGNSATYRWTGPNNFVSNERNPVVVQGVAGLYIVEATYPNNCGVGKDTVQIYNTNLSVYTTAYSVGNNPQPVNSICPGQSIAVQAQASYLPEGTTVSFQWKGPNGFISSGQSFTLTNAQETMTGSYSVTATFSGNCTGTATATQQVNVWSLTVPAGSFAFFSDGNRAPAQTICPGSDFGVGAYVMAYPSNTSKQVAFHWTGPNGFVSDVDSPTITNASTATSGLYSVTATVPGGCSGTNSVSITVGTPTVAAFSSDPNDLYGGGTNRSYCPGSSFRLSVSGNNSAATYVWSGPNGFSSTASSTTITNATIEMFGPYSVTATFSGGCSNTATAQVSASTPTVSINSHYEATASFETAFCTGSTVLIDAYLSSSLYPATYAWSGPNGFTSTAKSLTLANVSPDMSGNYSLTVTFSGGCPGTSEATKSILIGTPTLFLGNAPYACPGGELRLGAGLLISYIQTNIPASYRWTGPTGFTSTDQKFILPNATPAMAGTYSVTATLSGGCTGTITGFVQAQVKKPSLGIFSQATNKSSGGDQYCPGTSFDVYPIFFETPAIFPSSQSTFSYQWSGPNNFTSSLKQPTIPAASTLASGIYSLKATISGECSGVYTSSLEVNIGTARSFASAFPLTGLSQNDSYCPGSTVQVSSSTFPYDAEVISYQWRGPNGFTSSAKSFTLGKLSPANTGVYSLTTIYGGQCAGKRVDFVNIKAETPSVYIGVYRANGSGGPAFPLCPGNYYKLSPNVQSYSYDSLGINNTYEWILPTGSIATSSSLTINSSSAADAGRYILKTTLGGACAPAVTRDTIDLVVGIPSPRVWSRNLFIAKGKSTALLADQCAGEYVRWSDGQTGRSIVVSPVQTTVYTAVCVSLEGCLSPPSDPLTVQVSDQPEADLSVQLIVSNRTPALNQPVSITLIVQNSSLQEARNVQIKSLLPDFLSVLNTGDFQLSGNTLTATVPSVPANGMIIVTFQVTPIAIGTIRLAAQIMAADNPDPDSYPGSGTNDGQDDMSWVDLRTSQAGSLVSVSPEPTPALLPTTAYDELFLPTDKIDLSLQASVSNRTPAIDEVITITLQLDNYTNRRLLSPEVNCQLPAGLTFVGGANFTAAGQQINLSGGRFYENWPQTFSFQAQVTGPIADSIKAQISYCDWEDVDSNPANGFDTGEDDTAQIRLRVK
ncbi:hypothetical protein WBJ53_18500 [Spirosoma sp. SC4-14]|uniref:hypothetical protein n=1 Tax=Spirosoma sp. SC4-14 TaxID=3128900 RepID=UPI0030CBF1AC